MRDELLASSLFESARHDLRAPLTLPIAAAQKLPESAPTSTVTRRREPYGRTPPKDNVPRPEDHDEALRIHKAALDLHKAVQGNRKAPPFALRPASSNRKAAQVPRKSTQRQNAQTAAHGVAQSDAALALHKAALALHVPDDDIYRRHNLNIARGNAQLIAAERNKIRKALSATLLELRPRASAQAGAGGSAVATPVAHALFQEGAGDVDIVFDPSAVAVAGPGGFAKAFSDLIITVIGQ